MLQIITGKFYNSEDRYHNNCKGILYSNASFRGIYDIGHVKIEAAESLGNVDPYIVMYDNQLQKSHSGFELVKVGDEEILRQLKNILSFALDAVFDEDKSTVERICRKKESGRGKYPVPSEFINGTLDISKNVSDDEMKSCGVFLEQLLALNREDYINILNCIVAYNASVRLLSEDISLAYSMLNVAVTEGDKVEAQIKFGWEVDAYPVNEIAQSVDAMSEADVNTLVEEYYDKYEILLEGRDEKEFRKHVAVQAQIEIGFERFLDEKNS